MRRRESKDYAKSLVVKYNIIRFLTKFHHQIGAINSLWPASMLAQEMVQSGKEQKMSAVHKTSR